MNFADRSLLEQVKQKSQLFLSASAEIEDVLSGTSVLYLPTYRRIEVALAEYRVKSAGRRQNYGPVQSGSQLIHFGLQDVEDRLASLAGEIRLSTFRQFSLINGRTLDDLLFGDYKKNVSDSKSVDSDSLRIVLGRLGRDDDKTRKKVDLLISSGEIVSPENIYLKSFLQQLMSTYASTQSREASIENFVEVVNSYWADASEKSFVFDKASAEATVVNAYTGSTLQLEALSSGEKQIISVFAKLYLEGDEDVVVLIDEPELSLSMEWQAKFLPDVAKAENCRQLLAITHSPFIFQNELRPFAGDLEVMRHRVVGGAQ